MHMHKVRKNWFNTISPHKKKMRSTTLEFAFKLNTISMSLPNNKMNLIRTCSGYGDIPIPITWRLRIPLNQSNSTAKAGDFPSQQPMWFPSSPVIRVVFLDSFLLLCVSVSSWSRKLSIYFNLAKSERGARLFWVEKSPNDCRKILRNTENERTISLYTTAASEYVRSCHHSIFRNNRMQFNSTSVFYDPRWHSDVFRARQTIPFTLFNINLKIFYWGYR